MFPAPDIEIRPVRAQRAYPADEPLCADATRAWQFQFDLAWAYPRLCYAVWSRLMSLER